VEQPFNNSVDEGQTKFSVCLKKPMFKVLPESDARYPIPISVKTSKQHLANMSNYTNFDTSLSPNAKEWEENVRRAMRTTTKEDWLSGITENGEWEQGVTHEGVTLKASRHGFTAKDGLLTGEQALSHVQYIFGVGIYVSIPLWHSGIWVTIKAPMDSELLLLERMIEEEKLMLGRITSGFVFSNVSAYITQHLFNFIIDHIYDCNVKDYTRDMLRTLILQTDFQTLVWGLSLAIYPDGWPVSIPCTTNPERCMHVEKLLLDLGTISLTNLDGITPPMRKHMAIRSHKYTAEQIVSYQQGHVVGESREITIAAPNGELTVVLSVPSIQKHVDAGDRWISGIKDVINGIFDETDSLASINEYALKHSHLTSLREFSHWVKQIHINNVMVMKGNEEIDSALDSMSCNPAAVEAFMNGVKSYIEDATVSFICVANFDCPKCGDPMRSHDNIHPEIIPMDMASLFFSLKDRRLMRAVNVKIKK
jgi:hypothetical protein